MKPFALRLLLALILISWRAFGAPPAHRFEKDIATFEAQDQKAPPPKGSILFVGDSTFTKWKTIHEDLPEYTVINRGFGGSTMSDLLYFADRVVIPYQPRLIVEHSQRSPSSSAARRPILRGGAKWKYAKRPTGW
jgi:hypothetical protein